MENRAQNDPSTPRLEFYCSGCGKSSGAERRSCPHCGHRLIVKGYCTVCESSIPQPPGSLCPKHEIELISEAPDSPLAALREVGGSWVRVASYAHPFEAEAARIRLDAEGIPALLEGHRMNTTYPSNLLTGGTKLLVPSPMVQDARILLSQTWGPPVLDDFEESLDIDDELEDVDASQAAAFDPNESSPGIGPVFLWATLLAFALVALGLSLVQSG